MQEKGGLQPANDNGSETDTLVIKIQPFIGAEAAVMAQLHGVHRQRHYWNII